ncbi:Transcription-repair-coupling factor [Candidatus Erwinia haradaeae]|uniref:Transcription-repair-coupling factor n=1 Tax=Candidatus Erwinia haradaeae TaxID=1922217 RepID=A0A451CYW4_9GAMM|nr:transcription-repair coupling factor [Candidatus Erwinia haradaeae]VFP78586.1 Transcription-repair-coupling factor [Candidatus Erwinia haradaeae]
MPELYCYDLPFRKGDQRKLGQLTGSAYAIECAEIAERHHGLVILITQDIKNARCLQEELRQFTHQPVNRFPDWETLPFDRFSPDQATISARLSTLYQLPMLKSGILILSVHTLMQRVCPYNFLSSLAVCLKKGVKISRTQLRLHLKKAGYRSVHHIVEHGDFSNYDRFLDIFPMGKDQVYRIVFLDDQIHDIYFLDSDSQRTKKEITELNLLPAHEFPTNKDVIDLFLKQWRKHFDVRLEPEHVYQQVKKGALPAGIEYWQPLFFEEPLPRFFSYLPSNALLVISGELKKSSDDFWFDINRRYDNRRVDVMRPLLDPKYLWLCSSELMSALQEWPRIELQQQCLEEDKTHTNLEYSSLPDLSVRPKAQQPLDGLRRFLESFSGAVIFSVENEGRREVLQELLARINIQADIIYQLSQAKDSGCYLLIGSSEQGCIDHRRKRALICENDLLDDFVSYSGQDRRKTMHADILIPNFSDLSPGQPVVHIEHGVGRYLGLSTLETGGVQADYLMLAYAENAKLYIPMPSLHLISRYTGSSYENAPLHRLGGSAWLRARKKVSKKVRDAAAELLDIYAQRAAKNGFAFKHDKKQYQLFCESFPFKVTSDQKKAINAVLSDMCQPLTMDRLICGDVGFGKTEVAMRAAFLAVFNHKQVAVLVPTTLLAQQHYDNFRDRFANWPVCIKMLSRFRTEREREQVLKETKEGKVDILIGTHQLLQNKIKWHDLGLLVVDEEHRFGVRHKERIKVMRTDVDILTLTATPIPRTLNMAVHGMRDLSIISTPPARRLAVKTFVHQYDQKIIGEAILREILRGGQVYYLYNDVENIEKVTKKLSELVPTARIALGHGQMNERELERVMNDFYHQRFNVLVCTTIIETGIDIPTANTIIIEGADRFGLAQLHQLRGRVGRSHHQAYAWLLTPHPKAMTINAQKRLEAISSLEDLGVGLSLATHDLEIRGAGELLGEGQSGQIDSIGFSLYMELLEHAVNSLRAGNEPSLEDLTRSQINIDLKIPVFLPDSFIPDVNTRLAFYKRIASAKNYSELDSIKAELMHRFGLMPDSAHALFDTASLRLSSQIIGLKKIEAHETGGFIEFSEDNKIDSSWFLSLLKKEPNCWFLDGSTRIRFVCDLSERIVRIQWITKLIEQMLDNIVPM